MQKWVTQSYRESCDFYNCLNRKLLATHIAARLTATAESRQIKCAFILKALCTHDSPFLGLWCEVGKGCCFRSRNRQEACVCHCEQLGLGADWHAMLGLTSQPCPYLVRPFAGPFLPCCWVWHPSRMKLSLLLQGDWSWKMCICCLPGVVGLAFLLFFLFPLFPSQFFVQNSSTFPLEKNQPKPNKQLMNFI